MSLILRQLTPDDLEWMDGVLTLFGEVFDEVETYSSNRPSPEYLRRLLGGEYFIALAAIREGEVVGAIAAYELKKFEQVRSEIFIYDLAVSARHRREGIATAMIEELKKVAVQRGAYVMFVQANTEVEDEPAIALYSKMGTREAILHFDIHMEEKPEST